ncbi:MAG: hypothetical protein JWL58_839 [Streptosporangiaceae bacterium]|nr:hypothetical protein [Streptosporangiaceae bacterium]
MSIVIRKAGAESLDRLEPLWLALHAHHQSVMPGYAYRGRGTGTLLHERHGLRPVMVYLGRLSASPQV